jgi:UDP-N-acetylglucosamine 1-carboxyvinyltransferase
MTQTTSKPKLAPEVVQIGARISQYRSDKNLTQAQVAKQLGTSQSAVARMESGRQNISASMLVKIGDILDKKIISLTNPTLNLQIEGARKLSGSVVTKTSKNSAVVMLCAALLNRSTTTLKRMPKIEEVHRVIEVLESIGVDIRWEGSDIIITPPKRLRLASIDSAAAVRTRSIIFLLAALLHRMDEFELPHPGGCRLGARTVRPHLYALEKFGVKIDTLTDTYAVKAKRLHEAEVVLYESGDTTTENALMAAAGLEGTSVIKFASANYAIQDLCVFLQQLGVRIEGIGTTTLTVRGRALIDKPVTYSISEDPIESMLFIAAAATTRSQITIKRCPIDFLELELLKLEKMGFKYDRSKPYKAANGHTVLVDITTYPSRLRALDEKIYGRPYPGLNMDNLPFFAVIATQAKGRTLIHDWTYETRAIYYMELTKLGADMSLADPHRVFIDGPTKLRAAEVVCPPALRPAAIILIAMLAAEGTSILRNVYSINRGYEDIYDRLNALGANIQVLREL